MPAMIMPISSACWKRQLSAEPIPRTLKVQMQPITPIIVAPVVIVCGWRKCLAIHTITMNPTIHHSTKVLMSLIMLAL